MRFAVAGGLAQVSARQGVKSWRAWVAQRVVPTSVRHVCLRVLAGKYCTEGQDETHEAVRDVLLREDRLDSESGDEKGEGHCEASVVGVRFGIVMNVVEEKDGVGESDEADLERRKGFEDDVKRRDGAG